MNCPSCGEKNDADMHFCISCGKALTSHGAASHAAQQMATEEIQIAPGGNMVLFCPLCKKTDPLNGQFCVYCAGRTVPMVDPQAQNSTSKTAAASAPAFNAATGAVGPASYVMDENPARAKDIVRITAPQPKVANKKIAIAFSVLLGAAFAGLVAFFARPAIENASLSSFWPSDGLLILSSEPNTDFKLENTKKDTLILGKTSTDGSFQIQNISPGQYLLSLSNKSKSLGKMISVKSGEANIIGYPVRLKMN